MADEILQKLIEFIQNASPVVWGALIKQVYVEAISQVAWVVFLAVVSVLAYKSGKYYQKKNADPVDDDLWAEEKSWGAYIICGISAPISFALLVDAIMRLVNPEFYAIRFLLMQISGQ